MRFFVRFSEFLNPSILHSDECTQYCSQKTVDIFVKYVCIQLGHVAGDIVVILQQIPHPHFQREGQHLYIKKEIVLLEALCGGQFFIKHLDDRILRFNTLPGEILKPYQLKCIQHMGMPHKKDASSRGHIFIQFEIKFPSQPSNPHLINVCLLIYMLVCLYICLCIFV